MSIFMESALVVVEGRRRRPLTSRRRRQRCPRTQSSVDSERTRSLLFVLLLSLALAVLMTADAAAAAAAFGGGHGRRPGHLFDVGRSGAVTRPDFASRPRRHSLQQQQSCRQQHQQQLLLPRRLGLGGGSLRRPSMTVALSSASLSSLPVGGAGGDDGRSDNSKDGGMTSPVAFSSGFSTLPDLREALREATAMAVSGLPSRRTTTTDNNQVDISVGWVSVSSLYDGGTHSPATTVIPTVLEAIFGDHHRSIDHLIGSSAAGCVSSTSAMAMGAMPSSTVPTKGPTTKNPAAAESSSSASACRTVEFDSVPAVSITLAILPDVTVDSFVVSASDVPDGDFRQQLSVSEWRRAVGLSSSVASPREEGDTTRSSTIAPPPVFNLIMSPAFAPDLDSLVTGMEHYYPGCQVVGGVASTVSSLSRAKLYQWSRTRNGISSASPASFTCVTDGCIGLACQGDVEVRQMMALGAKPVGGIYQVLKASGSTISVIVLDPVATDALQESSDTETTAQDDAVDDEAEDSDRSVTPEEARQKMAQFYAKAQIPKPVLAEANFLMRTLSDDDQAFMRRQLLVGLEQGGGLGRTASELARLAAGQGHRFAIHPVASAGMKDGSVTLPLGSVNVQPGTRLRFFVREADFAKKEVEALWSGYMKRTLTDQFAKTVADADRKEGSDRTPRKGEFRPAACFVIPTLDRGPKFFLGKPGYEGSTVTRVLPGVTSVSGFYSNGVVGRIDGTVPPSTASASDNALQRTGVQGSASGYFLWGPRSGRPIFSPAQAAAEAAARREAKDAEDREARLLAEEDARRVLLSSQRSSRSSALVEDRAAPRSEDGELILKRREVHSGRALTVSTVEWSVAEKLAKPSSALEGYMWEKETEVDRFRERVPLANLVSQCRQSANDPSAPKPRDWIGPVVRAAQTTAAQFAIVPECKRMEPTTGSLRRRYDVSKLAREYTLAGVPALSVNCDAVLFGGSLEDVTLARAAASSAAVEPRSTGGGGDGPLDDDGVVVPPVLASDLVLYPYQLYKLRLSGADAVTLVAGALARKDLLYLTKIASNLQLQVLVTVTSHVQIDSLLDLPTGSFQGLIVSNRILEDFSFDMTGNQALELLRGDALRRLRDKLGADFPVLVEGRVGIIDRSTSDDKEGDEGDTNPHSLYVDELRRAGAIGAIVGGGMAVQSSSSSTADILESLTVRAPLSPSSS